MMILSYGDRQSQQFGIRVLSRMEETAQQPCGILTTYT